MNISRVTQAQCPLITHTIAPVGERSVGGLSVNRLLRFVQTAFEYKTDEDQFNTENYLFPLETLHYPYSDCEDRSALCQIVAKPRRGGR